MTSSGTTYQSAKNIAALMEDYFLELSEIAVLNAEKNLAEMPAALEIESIIDAAFWASLRKEEGHVPKISMAFLSPESAQKPVIFSKSLPLSAKTLTKLAPGVERAGIHLGVWKQDDELVIWGTTSVIPNYCFVVDVSEPGLIVIKHRRLHGFGKYTNVAVLKGDEIKIIDEHCGRLPDCPAIVTALLDLNSDCSWNDNVNIMILLAVSMRAHGHGGILLVVPPGDEEWQHSVIHPNNYQLEPSYNGLSDLIAESNHQIGDISWQNELRKEVESIAGLTAVDGATVITRNHQLLAFGAKISRKYGNHAVEQLSYIEPVLGGEPVRLFSGEIGGTRHLSAAQFIHDQHDSLAMVASQDGHFTVFSWSDELKSVQAHRIDSLLL